MLQIKKRFIFKPLFIFYILLFSCVFAEYKYRIENITVQAVEKDSLITKYLIDIISNEKYRFEHFFNYKLTKKVNIILSHSEEEYKQLVRFSVPHWSQGVAFVQARKIILKPGNYFDPVESRELILHELSHIYLADKLQKINIPIWLNEGIAMYLSGKNISLNESILLGNALISGNVVSFAEMDSLLKFGAVKANIAYLEALLATQYIINQHGEKIIQQILDGMNNQITFDIIFKQTIDQDLEDFEFQFYSYLQKRYRWMVLLQFKNLLWISFVVLVIIVFVTIKIRNRRLLKEWDETER